MGSCDLGLICLPRRSRHGGSISPSKHIRGCHPHRRVQGSPALRLMHLFAAVSRHSTGVRALFLRGEGGKATPNKAVVTPTAETGVPWVFRRTVQCARTRTYMTFFLLQAARHLHHPVAWESHVVCRGNIPPVPPCI